MIRSYVSADFAESYVEPGIAEGCASIDELPENVRTRYRELKAAMRWPALTFSTEHPRFRGVYAVLGELLLIGKERVILTIVDTPAKNFDHGISLSRFRPAPGAEEGRTRGRAGRRRPRRPHFPPWREPPSW
jgi:hypothetical protein